MKLKALTKQIFPLLFEDDNVYKVVKVFFHMQKIKIYAALLFLIFLVFAVFMVSAFSKEQSKGSVFFEGNNQKNVKADYEKSLLKRIIDNQEPKKLEISQEIKENAYLRIKEKLKDKDDVDILVWVNDGYSPEEIISNFGDFKVKYVYDILNGFSGTSKKEDIELLRNDKRVNYIAPDEKVAANLLQSRAVINATTVQNNLNLSGSSVGFCHLDTGVNYNHVNIAHAYVGGYDIINNDPDPMDDNGHGTSTAGVVVSNHSLFKGIAPNANLVSVKVLDAAGFGTTSGVAAGINWCLANKNLYNISVISMSLGTLQTYTPATNPGFYDSALQTVYNNNIVSVASVGNSGVTNGLTYPGISPYVVSVGATYDVNLGTLMWTFGTFNCTDNNIYANMVTCFSNRASFLDLMAPGALISTTSLSGGLASNVGTSFAAPHVTGTIALMAQRNRNLLPSQFENILKSTGLQVYDNTTGLNFSRVNAWNAVLSMPYLSKTGSLAPNSIINFNINAPGESGNSYILGLAFTTSPGVVLPDGREVPLTLDQLLLLSIQSPQSVFLSNNFGVINNGFGQANLTIPNIPGIQNVEAYAAFVTINPSGQIVSVSNAVRL